LETVPGYPAALAVDSMDAEISKPRDLTKILIGTAAGHAKDDRPAGGPGDHAGI
jgi:hypothetical protein